VRQRKLNKSFSGKRHNLLLIGCIAAALCFSQVALAQSGRRPQSGVASTAAPPTTTGAAPVVDPSTVKMPSPISNVIVVGDLVQSGKSYSNYVDEAVDACVEELKKRQVIEAVGSGSRKRDAAIERAKAETESYVLWLEIKLVDQVRTDRGVYVEEYISCVNYYVFMPQTAKILTEGRVYPGSQALQSGGVVLRLPTRSTRASVTRELRDIGRQVANRVRDSFVEHRTAKAEQ
jgi:hypothetical protein